MPELPQIVQQMTLSDEQQPAILASGDVAVTAGAGAGKTRTLVARYLSLLDAGMSPRQVVAITFTRKAAREMRNRVRREVHAYLASPNLEAQVQRRWQEIYTALDAARIGTIHSLCGEILRHHPAEAGLDPRFEMLDEGQMALLQARVLDEALAWAADDAGATVLFGLWGEHRLRDILGRMMAQRLDVTLMRETLAGDLWEDHWLPRLSSAMQSFVKDEQTRACLADLSALRADGTLDRAMAAGDALAPLLGDLLSCWDAIQAACQEEDWIAVAAELAPFGQALKQKGRKATWAPADPKAAIAELQALYDDRLGDLIGGYRSPAPVDLELDRRLARELLPQLYRVYDMAVERYVAAKRERPALDFDDLEARAVDLLRRHDLVRAYWRATIQALLVDEFQDTNLRQRELLELLNDDAGKLFIVGDGKQSIYRFRGADVTVYRQERRRIALNGRAYNLATSYRAHGALIDGLNALLEPVLGPEEDPARPYVEPFGPLRPHRHQPAPGLRAPYIELHLARGSKSGGALERAARALVARLVELVQGGSIRIWEDGPDRTRALDYGDVAILCRATRAFPAYESALEEAGVPFLTVAGRGFYERPEVRDLLNALRALDDPTDDLALAGLLRSPACRLSDMALYRLRCLQRESKAPSLWALLCAGDLASLGHEAALCQRACELIQQLQARVGRVPVADVLKALLDDTGYRAALLRAAPVGGEARGARNVSKLLVDAQNSDMVSVGAFIEYVAQLRDVGTREGEAHTVATGAVQVMSVHAAKGLEFPVLVIGDAGRQSPRTRGTLIDPELGVLPPLQEERTVEDASGRFKVETVDSAIYRLAQRAARDREEAESDRLLYVAATRAKEMLLLSGVVGRSLDGWLKRLDAALPLGEWLKEIATEGTEARTETWEVGGQAVRCAVYPEGVEVAVRAADVAPPEPVDLPERPRLLRALAPEPVVADEETGEEARDPPRRVWRVVPDRERARAPAWVVGQIVHGALEGWLFPDAGSPGGASFVRWAEAEAKGCGITDAREIQDALQRARRILTRFTGTALYTRMQAAETRLHEVPYSRIDEEGRLEHGVIDALFREGEAWTLVEFKTDWIRGPDALEDKLATQDYVPQVARYLAAVEELLGVRPRPVLCLLSYGRAVRLVEDRWS